MSVRSGKWNPKGLDEEWSYFSLPTAAQSRASADATACLTARVQRSSCLNQSGSGADFRAGKFTHTVVAPPAA